MAMYDSSYDGEQIDAAVAKVNGLESKTAASGGTDESLVTTGEKYTWDHKQDSLGINSSTGSASKYLNEQGNFTTISGGGTIDYVVVDQNVPSIDSTIIAQALRKTAQSLTAAEKAQVLTNLGISSVAAVAENALLKTSQSLTSGEKSQVLTNLGISSQIAAIRNITVSTSEPTSADGSDGDIWLVYEA